MGMTARRPMGLVSSLRHVLPFRLRANLKQWFHRAAHEEEFHLLDALRDAEGLFLDIGANRGQAAISVLRRTRRLRVLSMEPNPELRWSLAILRVLHPGRFRFRLIGAGADNQQMTLLVPFGGADLSSQASLDPHEFEKEHVKERLSQADHEGGGFKCVRVTICRLDDLGLRPHIVKIDVEGWETQVLEGMARTIELCKPMFIIEINDHRRWAPLLADLGYRFYSYAGGRFRHLPRWHVVPGVNLICIHPDGPPILDRSLLCESPDLP